MGENIENEIENKNFSNIRPILADIIDTLSNSYYLKISLNRICENETEEFSLNGIPKEILDGILIMNDYIVQIKEVYDILKENIPIFFLWRFN